MDKLAGALGGTFLLILLIFMVVLAIYWLVLPLLICSKLDKIAKLIQATNQVAAVGNIHADQTAGNTRQLAAFFDGRNVKMERRA